MCGIAAAAGTDDPTGLVAAILAAQEHRGPDARDHRTLGGGQACLGLDRLRIIDLSPTADGVQHTDDGRWHLTFNGEVFNHHELRTQLPHHRFRTSTDSEVVLAAWAAWGPACLDRLVGFFAFALWDDQERRLHAARDRFGVKPLVHHQPPGGGIVLANEPAALLQAGVPATPDDVAWATYLVAGTPPEAERTFWADIAPLAAGHRLEWSAEGGATVRRWYDLPRVVGDDHDPRPDDEVAEQVEALLHDAVRLRTLADVPVGVALSSGLDSGALLALLDRTARTPTQIDAFTFTTGDPAYDEDDAVASLVAQTPHVLHRCPLAPDEVPDLAASVHGLARQPVGGLPTLAYARLFEVARAHGSTVVLDGQGLDEAWAGYDYYTTPGATAPAPVVQGASAAPGASEAVLPELAALARTPEPPPPPPGPTDRLRQTQLRDLLATKLPRALRYNDLVSMRSSVELREPFLDHRLVELALRQPPHRTVGAGEGKALLRRLAPRWAPWVRASPAKQAVQTPQREWLRGPLREWASDLVDAAVQAHGGTWLDAAVVRRRWADFLAGEGDSAAFAWTWISLGLEAGQPAPPSPRR